MLYLTAPGQSSGWGWTDADRTNYLDFLRRIEQLYTSGPAGLSRKPAKDLMLEGLIEYIIPKYTSNEKRSNE